MPDDLEALGRLVYQRARAVETAFDRLRARDFPTRHFDQVVRFSINASREVQRSVPRQLGAATQPGVDTAAVGRLLQRYGQIIEFVHESLDFVENAEVLSVPAPFVLFLEELSSRLIPEPRFVLRADPLFNYSFTPVGETLNAPLQRAGIRARLPDHFAVFRFPAALRDDGLEHCLLAHEVGHYVDSVENLSGEAWSGSSARTQERVVRFITTQAGACPQGAPSDLVDRGFRALASWISETVCDVLAALMVGPAYLLSAQEFTTFASDMDIGTDTHPPSMFRLWVAWEQLRRMRWETVLARSGVPMPTAVVPALVSARDLKALPSEQRFFRILERCLLHLLPPIRRVVRAWVGQASYRPAHFYPWEEDLRQLLANRIALGEVASSTISHRPVPPQAALNAGWLFHLTGYAGWSNPPGGRLAAEVAKRQLLSRLILKGLEISYVSRHWGRVPQEANDGRA